MCTSVRFVCLPLNYIHANLLHIIVSEILMDRFNTVTLFYFQEPYKPYTSLHNNQCPQFLQNAPGCPPMAKASSHMNLAGTSDENDRLLPLNSYQFGGGQLGR